MSNAPASATSPTSLRETRFYGLGLAATLITLFFFNTFTIQPPLTPVALFAYALISLAGAADAIITTRPRIARVFDPRDHLRQFLLLETVELAMLFAVALILRGRAEVYFYLATFDGYSTYGIRTGRRRKAAAWVTVVAALAGLSYAVLWGWKAAGAALLGDLPWYGFVIVVAEFITRQWRQRERAERLAAELAEAHRQLQDYTARAEELAVAHERARLAHEIHDTLGHALTALDVQLELLARLPPGQADQRQQIAAEARSLVKQGLADVRRAVQALRPVALETFSLPEAITGLAADFEQAADIPTVWKVEGEIAPLHLRLALPLYRTAQEALTNIQRHAPTTPQVTVHLRYGSEFMALSVINAPPLSHTPTEGSGGGYGLRGLRERAEALGGEFSAGSDETGGFRVEMRLPVTGE